MKTNRPCTAWYDTWDKKWIPMREYVSEELLDIALAIRKTIDRGHDIRMW